MPPKAKADSPIDNVVRPKKPSTAYIFFNTETAKKIREKNSNLNNTEVFQKVAQVWAALNDKQKEKYVKMAEADKQRFEKQTKELEDKGFFIMADGSKSTSTDKFTDPKKKYGADCVVPKKPCSAYLLFNAANIKRVKEEEKIEKYPEAMKRMGVIWNEMSDAEKEKWNKEAAKDKARHDKQLAELMKKGWFKMDDGSKSSDHKAKIKQKRSRNSQPEEEEVEQPKAKKQKTK